MRIPGLHLKPNSLLTPVCWLALACCPAQASAEDLYQLYQKALAHDMKFAAAQAQQLATAEKEPQSRANLLPNLSITGGAAWVDAEDSSDYHRNRNNTNAYAVVLTQPLLRWQNVIAHDQSKLLISASEVQTEQSRQDLMLRVARAYFDVLLNRELLNTRTQQLQTLLKSQDRSRRLLADGAATANALEQVQAQYDQAFSEQIAARGALDLANQVLTQLTAAQARPWSGKEPQFSVPVPAAIDDWAHTAQQGNLAVQAAQIARHLAEMDIDKERAGHLPTLDLIAAHGRFASVGGDVYDVTLPENRYNQTVVGVKLSVPLYAGGSTSSRVREAHALLSKAVDEVEDASRRAGLMARQAYLQVTSGMSQYQALKQALKSSEVNLASVTHGFEAGSRINTDVLDAQQKVIDTQQRLAQQRYAILLAQLNLLASTGNLNDVRLHEISNLLN
ncbi:TolC family outer membrane protein [Pseudomonas fluorescens]|uniref:TolC family outer membrane protein n=1 Tax=Pseudomonas fluorescens TaxID=294 RepID=UPI001BE8E1EF|nr:TolC family outer membrane protein [Pseudomonas fluorescens]MBT2370462.1 TolC family outer membrane protein [Pseudomonas fluorescens]